MLSQVLAQQIASETTEAIGHNVIITDTDGVVIGSGDADRVGAVHEASLDVVRTQESTWHSPDQARALHGVKPGMTLPLVIDGDTVGTVGITGSPRQVRRFGLLVRRQTEILLEESALLRTRLLRERALEDFLAEVNAYDTAVTDPNLLAATARDLGFTLELPRVPILLQIDEATIGPELLRAVRAVFHQPEDIVATRSTNRCQALVHAHRARQVDTETKRLIESIRERFNLAVRGVIGEPATTPAELRETCQDASDALSLAIQLEPDTTLSRSADLRTHQALASLPPRARQRLTATVLGELGSSPDWPVLRATVIAWCESGLSLVRASASLQIHRNTLVYRLDKIAHITGQPWRDHKSMLALYLASLADQIQPPT